MKKTKLFLFIFILLLFPLNVFASTNTEDRTNLPNYGVTKKEIKITEKNRRNVLKAKKVDASEKVYDFAEIFSETEEKQLFEKIEEFSKKHNMDFAILTDSFSYYNDNENRDYAVDFYDYNDFGIDYEKYNGILIFINMNPSDRYYNFYLTGDSQLYFNDSRKSEPINKTMSYMKSGNYYNAITEMMDLFDSYLDNGVPSDLDGYYVDDMGYLKRPFTVPWLPIIGADLIIILITMIILVKKNKMVKKKLEMNAYFNKNGADYRVKTDQFIRSYVTSHTVSSSSGGSGGGGGHSSFGGSSGIGHSSGSGGHF